MAPARIGLDELASSNRLFLDYVRAPERVSAFFPRRGTLQAVEDFARNIRKGPVSPGAVADVLEHQQVRWGVRPDPARRLASGGVAVVTGQQAGLFTGPMLAILKALTAVKVARHLVSSGIDAVPVFWIASEDHDRGEIASADVVDSEAQLQRFQVVMDGPLGSPVGRLSYSGQIATVIDGCFSALGKLECALEARELVESAYQAGRSPVDAFAIMMGRLFRTTELIFLDPLDPGFRELARPVIARAFARSKEMAALVRERTSRIVEAGYPAQVRVGDDFTGFFSIEEGERRSLAPGDRPRGDLSPSALVRPMVQDAVLGTAAIVAGPAEVAYFAQAGPVYDCMQVPVPPSLPRITATIVEPAAARALRHYGLTIPGVYAGEEELRRKIAGEGYDIGRFGRARETVRAALEELRPMLEGTDPTLDPALDTALRKVTYQADRLERRFVHATTRRDEVRDRAVRTLRNRLAPYGKPQERVLCPLGFVARYGLGLVPLLDRSLDLDGSFHQVIEL